MSESPGRLEQVLGHWMPRIQVAGITAGDAARVVREAGEWPRWCQTWSAEGERHVDLAEEATAQVAKRRTDQDTLIDVMFLNPQCSIADWADFCGWTAGKDKQPYKSKVHRLLTQLKKLRLARKDRAGQWTLSVEGRDLAKAIVKRGES